MRQHHDHPRRERPLFPEGYGLPTDRDTLLEWSTVRQELTDAQHYWLSTVRPDGRPHVVPRWGVWLDDAFWYDGAPTTRHARNVELNSAVTLTLESGTRAVILEGASMSCRAEPSDLGQRLSTAFGKYADLGYAPAADAWAGADGGGLRVIRPNVVLAWFAFPGDATRFVF